MREQQPDLSDLKRISNTMDNHFRGPFGWRFGWDGLLGLFPLAGDMVTNAISIYVILRAAQLGVSPTVILRMGLNLLVENLVDIVPFFGNIFDFFWKANTKNMALVEKYFEDPTKVRRNSAFVLALAVTMVIAAVIGFIALSLWFALWVYEYLAQGNWTV